MTTDEERAAHLAARPVPDGSLRFVMIDSSQNFTWEFSDNRTWDSSAIGVALHEGNDDRVSNGKTIIFYGAIASLQVTSNTLEYATAQRKWFRDCDHDWLSHPHAENYCRHCRMLFENLTDLFEDSVTGTLPTVPVSAEIDRQAEKYDGKPHVHDQDGPAIVVVKSLVGLIQPDDDVCTCDQIPMPHEGVCKIDPSTWDRASDF